MTNREVKGLLRLRRTLHQDAELSGQEVRTARIILDFVSAFNPDWTLRGLGGNGLAVAFEGGRSGPTVVFRSELDALPVAESGELPHRSLNDGVSHKCGHDGHMAMCAGLGRRLARLRPPMGRVVLLFQPAEETGAGAGRILEDKRFSDIVPDYIFALHNLPGFPLRRVLIRDGVFNFASTGLVAKFVGAEAHAAYPEQGISPATAVAEMISELTSLTQKVGLDGLVTIVHARLGDVAFGTAPGYGEVMATLRSRDDDQLRELTDEAANLVTRIARMHGLDAEVEWRDAFSTTYNHPEAVKVVERAALACGLEVERRDSPYRWSEDFGRFTARYPGALFCLGSGEHCPPLHSAAYDFPDALIETGVDIFSRIIDEVLGPPDR